MQKKLLPFSLLALNKKIYKVKLLTPFYMRNNKILFKNLKKNKTF